MKSLLTKNTTQRRLIVAGLVIILILLIIKLEAIGLFFPTAFWWVATFNRKNKKYPVSLMWLQGSEVAISVLFAFLDFGRHGVNAFLSSIAQSSAVFGAINLIGGIAYFVLRNMDFGDDIIRGTKIVEDSELRKELDRGHRKHLDDFACKEILPRLSIGGVELPAYLENLGIFTLGSPGSGKSQAIAQLLSELKQRPDFRVIIFDRNAEMLEKYYDEHKDLIFNPVDARSVLWSHKTEQARPETIAAGLIPEFAKDPFFNNAARNLLSDLYERCDNNAEIWGSLTSLTTDQLKDFVAGGLSQSYFISEKTGGSVLSSLINYVRFYKELPDEGEKFSFVEWARDGDSRSLFLPLFEEDSELFKPLYSMVFELILKGLLSNEGRKIKTAIVIDELGALNKLNSLSRLLSESRKFGGCPILGTQAGAQVKKVYGDEDFDILKQTTKTKLILNCPDPTTALIGAELIGKVEKRELNTTYSGMFGSKRSRSENIRETYAVLPSEIQALPKLEGYLLIADGSSSAKVKITPQSYPSIAKRLIRRAIP